MFKEGDLCISWRVLGVVCFLLAFFVLLAYFLFHGMGRWHQRPARLRSCLKKNNDVGGRGADAQLTQSASATASTVDSKYKGFSSETAVEAPVRPSSPRRSARRNLRSSRTVGAGKGLTLPSAAASAVSAPLDDAGGLLEQASMAGSVAASVLPDSGTPSDGLSESPPIDPNALLPGALAPADAVADSKELSASPPTPPSPSPVVVSKRGPPTYRAVKPRTTKDLNSQDEGSLPQVVVSSRSQKSQNSRSSGVASSPKSATERLHRTLLHQRQQLAREAARRPQVKGQ